MRTPLQVDPERKKAVIHTRVPILRLFDSNLGFSRPKVIIGLSVFDPG